MDILMINLIFVASFKKKLAQRHGNNVEIAQSIDEVNI